MVFVQRMPRGCVHMRLVLSSVFCLRNGKAWRGAWNLISFVVVTAKRFWDPANRICRKINGTLDII